MSSLMADWMWKQRGQREGPQRCQVSELGRQAAVYHIEAGHFQCSACRMEMGISQVEKESRCADLELRREMGLCLSLAEATEQVRHLGRGIVGRQGWAEHITLRNTKYRNQRILGIWCQRQVLKACELDRVFIWKPELTMQSLGRWRWKSPLLTQLRWNFSRIRRHGYALKGWKSQSKTGVP